jgi:predicted DsbA family dithiol-disulfide isomerase
MTAPVRVDVWSDIACPWCFIGKRRFETAEAEFAAAGGAVDVEYHSYELDPGIPVDLADDVDYVDYITSRKGMGAAQVRQMLDQMTELATAEGLAFDYAALRHTNTIKAHELLHHAKAKGRQLDMSERLFAAYFEEGRHIGRIEDLADLAAEIGLDRDEVLESLTSESYLSAVDADKAQAVAYGISGVPFFVIDGRFGISGAQSPAAILDVLQQASAGVEAGR